VPDQVAARQLGERRVTVHGFRLAEPVIHQHKRVLAIHHRPAHDQPAERCRKEDVHERLACGPDSDGVDALAQLIAVERPIRGQ
jgi:hypothetical protein